ncbi:hypothetical protein AGDE_14354 [Angomonas deanei]|uniref:Uncharacterized protein n=1 Tax=Angomonas deanei TaxID=59799 RepID=A0A7G2CA19_9TRYP|nr:hypothetical protein AGDE_14354 [Angomonas deanei]CAD2215901.1 hypothetical protein, conserved [Angomonas deanei]|eukprot:EPY20998.1 hypothetical protein AGDE_14354 [Angomonas deanei]
MALTLRKKCVTSDETLLALKRLHCLSHGVALGAGAASLCSVMEETAPGLLCLLGIREKLPTEEKSLCEAIVQHIGDVQAGLDVLCRALVKGCTQERTHRFAVENRIEPVILYQDERCDVRERAMGLNFILGQNRSNLSSGLLYCLVEYCASSRVDGVEQGDDDSQLIRIIEEALFHREAEDIFGPSSTVLSILRFLLLVLSLGSVVCEKWALEFLIAALSGDFFAAQTKNLSAQQQTYAKEKLNELRLVVSRACSLNTGGDTFPNSDAFVQCNKHLEKAVRAFADGEEDATSVTAEEEAVRRLEGLKDELFLATAKNFVSHISVAVTNIETLIEESFNTTKPSEGLYPIVQSILLNLVYIIFHINDTTSATRAIQCLTWIGIYRLDSPNSSFLSGVLLKGLTLSPVDYPVGLVKRNGDEQQKTLARIRLLDVVLALCDDDDCHLTLRHLDEACRTALASPFHHLLVSLCRAQEDLSLQAAALHCLGQYTVALYPRVPLRIPLHLAEDVFRQGKHEMVKAAAASMMRCVAALIVDQAAAEDVDIQEVFQLTKAMSNYSAKETTTESFQHADIIRHHGKSACEELVSYFPSLLISEVAQ